MEALNSSFVHYAEVMGSEELANNPETFGLSEDELTSLRSIAEQWVSDLKESDYKNELMGMFVAGFMFGSYYAYSKDFSQLLPND
jgi:hypothetical protein